jgi:hypothetical protein
MKIFDLSGEGIKLLMGTPQKFIQQTQFIYHFKSRRMNRIAAKIAQEISVLFEHCDFDSRPREQKTQHHSGGTSACNAAANIYCVGG